LPFTPDSHRRIGDYSQYDQAYLRRSRKHKLKGEWAVDHELYRVDLTELDLGLVEDKLDRALRTIHADHLQMDSKPRKVLLVVPSLLPTPILEIALKVIFGHFSQPPSVSILTSPVLSCVSAGLRHALVVDIGWEETTVTVVGEYKEICQRRSVRAGKMLTKEMANMVELELAQPDNKMTFEEAEDLVQRMAWCRPRSLKDGDTSHSTKARLPVPGVAPATDFSIDFNKLADPVEQTLFASHHAYTDHDDHDLPIHLLVHRVLLALPMDLRSTCISRIVLIGPYASMLGLKQRLLHEISALIQSRGWDVVSNYGSAKQRFDNFRHIGFTTADASSTPIDLLKAEPSPGTMTREPSPPISQDPTAAPFIHASEREHDDVHDPITLKAERRKPGSDESDASNAVRGVESLGPWAGASLIASLKIQGVREIDKDDFNKHGYREI
jgi:actin-related protein